MWIVCHIGYNTNTHPRPHARTRTHTGTLCGIYVIGGCEDFDKRARDREAWTPLLARYRTRLEREDVTAARPNPRFVPRNHILETVIARSKEGDHDGVRALLAKLQTPYDAAAFEGEGEADALVAVPEWAHKLVVT